MSSSRKQLLCLARAVLRGSFCLILDEATSSLDKQNEIKFMEAVQKAYKEKTVIAIAVCYLVHLTICVVDDSLQFQHRLKTILNYDRVIVMDGGRIVQDGSPKDLKKDKNGRFYKLLNQTL